MEEDNKKMTVEGGDVAVCVGTPTRDDLRKDKKEFKSQQFRSKSSSSFFDRDRFRIKDKKEMPFYW